MVQVLTHLDGQILIAMPVKMDPRFERVVMIMCSHSNKGAMGIIINKISHEMSFGSLLAHLKISSKHIGAPVSSEISSVPIFFGGPVEPTRGFVIHTSDYFSQTSSLAINDHIAMTATIDILKDIAEGQGPRRSILAMGYAGWSPGQLEQEIRSNGWLYGPADEELLFDLSYEDKYDYALKLIGVDPMMLSAEAGTA